jgi:5-methylcytosine-specific restriction endonuclease McrA
MPIRPENKDLYPKDWPQISKAIRERAGNRCETCGAPNGVYIMRGNASHAGTYMLPDGQVFDAKTGKSLGVARGSEYNSKSMVKVVLTVAHLDHQPPNCDPANLRALCQRCHNAYDAPMRRAGIAARARAGKAMGDLFAGVTL